MTSSGAELVRSLLQPDGIDGIPDAVVGELGIRLVNALGASKRLSRESNLDCLRSIVELIEAAVAAETATASSNLDAEFEKVVGEVGAVTDGLRKGTADMASLVSSIDSRLDEPYSRPLTGERLEQAIYFSLLSGALPQMLGAPSIVERDRFCRDVAALARDLAQSWLVGIEERRQKVLAES